MPGGRRAGLRHRQQLGHPGRGRLPCRPRADNIVCDSVKACRLEAGEFVGPLETGVFDWNRTADLADVVNGTAVGRSTKDSIVLFKSVGLAIEDVALAAKLLELARANGKGQPLPF